MLGINYIQKNRIVVDPTSTDDNTDLVAGTGNEITTGSPIWFTPVNASEKFEEISEEVESSASSGVASEHDVPSFYANEYGFVSGAISFSTRRFWANEDGSRNDYPGDEKYWYLVNSQLRESMMSGAGMVNSMTEIQTDLGGVVVTNDDIISKNAISKIAFYSQSVISGCGEKHYVFNTNPSGDVHGYDVLSPGWTGTNDCLPVGLAMSRDIVTLNGGVNYNNFGIYGFVIIMPFYIEPDKIAYGLSLGRELFVNGNGLKIEVFAATMKESIVTPEGAYCYFSQNNLVPGSGDNSSSSSASQEEGGSSSPEQEEERLGTLGGLDELFIGGDGKITLSKDKNVYNNRDFSCKNIHHSVIDLSSPGSDNGVFYFENGIKYTDNVKYLVFGMRPYDINGTGTEYPPKTNPYSTDTAFLGNYALVDISMQKFYLV